MRVLMFCFLLFFSPFITIGAEKSSDCVKWHICSGDGAIKAQPINVFFLYIDKQWDADKGQFYKKLVVAPYANQHKNHKRAVLLLDSKNMSDVVKNPIYFDGNISVF